MRVDGSPSNSICYVINAADVDALGYLVLFTTDATQPDREWVVEDVVEGRTSTTVHGLSPLTTYYFKVQARNSVDYGPFCPTVIFRTPAGEYYFILCLTYAHAQQCFNDGFSGCLRLSRGPQTFSRDGYDKK